MTTPTPTTAQAALATLSLTAAEQTAGNAAFIDVTGMISAVKSSLAETSTQLTNLKSILTAANGSDANIAILTAAIAALV